MLDRASDRPAGAPGAPRTPGRNSADRQPSPQATAAGQVAPTGSGGQAGSSRPGWDSLSEVSWVDKALSPAKAVPQPSGAAPLSAQNVGRSAWGDELANISTTPPPGWERLSWEDLDDRADPAGGSGGDGGWAATPQRSSFGQFLREWVPVVLAAVVIAFITRMLLVQAYHIPSPSMNPTLVDGDRVIVNRLSYQFSDIGRGDIVVFAKPPNQSGGADDLIKRVVGLPGETIVLRDGQVFVEEWLVEEPYLAQPDSTRPKKPVIPGCDQPNPERDRCVVPEGYVFVMGDNRNSSSDSRVFGPISTDTIVGRAFVRVWPLDSIAQL